MTCICLSIQHISNYFTNAKHWRVFHIQTLCFPKLYATTNNKLCFDYGLENYYEVSKLFFLFMKRLIHKNQDSCFVDISHNFHLVLNLLPMFDAAVFVCVIVDKPWVPNARLHESYLNGCNKKCSKHPPKNEIPISSIDNKEKMNIHCHSTCLIRK